MIHLHKKDVIYRCIGDDFNEGVIACGYMPKPTSESSQYHFITGYYSGFIVLSGSGTFIEEDGTQYAITPGCFVQRLPGHIHSTKITPDGQWLEFFVCFGKSIYEYMRQLNMLPSAPVIMSDCDILHPQKLFSQFDIFMKKLKAARRDEMYLLLPDIQKIVLDISRARNAEQISLGASVHAAAPNNLSPAISAACDILSENFAENIDLPQLADCLHMSYENFRKQFSRQTGTSPASYRRQQRIRHSQLLLSSGISIKEVAQMIGYADTYAFTKQFTKIVGTSPGRYVKEMQKPHLRK